MKKLIIVLAILFLCLGISFCLFFKEKMTIITNAEVMFCDNRLDTDLAFIYKNEKSQIRAVIPIVPILNVLGCRINWLSSAIAEVHYQGNVYLLDLDKKGVFESKDKRSNLLDALGERWYREVVSNDLLVDSTSLSCALLQIGIPVIIDIDIENRVVRISENRTATLGGY